MRIHQCIDVEGTIYHKGEYVCVNGFYGSIVGINFMSITVTNEEEKHKIDFDDVLSISKEKRPEGTYNWENAFKNYF